MKKCTKCGSKSPDDMNYCSQCGEPLIKDKETVKPTPSRKGMHLPLMAGAAVALLLVAIVLGSLVIQRKNLVSGTWRFEKMEVTEFPAPEWELSDIELRLLPNNRFIIKADSRSLNGTYETEKLSGGSKAILLTYEDKSDKILYKDGHIYISQEGYSLVLTR